MQNACADALCVRDVCFGFEVVAVQDIGEISGRAYIMQHIKTGARLLWLSCADQEKAFAISFKTPPQDDTGVFHILEHSVLCGSEKYPVKEPFVHLLKSSMQTFLNAMTFADKTMYPVASTNTKDLMNLIDVYLDAVFFPNIYKNPQIFAQEGHHLEVADTSDPRSLFYNGVVFNEMKGALSDPDEVLILELERACFPDSAYGFESGGDPVSIPELTYESFLDSHARHYSLSNSYTTLYGDIDIKPMLEYLHTRFLEVSERQSARGEGASPNPLCAQAPVTAKKRIRKMAINPQNACMALCYVLKASPSQTDLLGWKILLDALAGSNDAPLKKAVLDAGLGTDFFVFFNDGVLQPQLYFLLKGPAPKASGEFRSFIINTLTEFVDKGLDIKKIKASLSHTEFALRERDFGGLAAGVVYAIGAMQTWLYNDTDPTGALFYEDTLTELKSGLKEGFFENLIIRDILESSHNGEAEIIAAEEDLEDLPNTAPTPPKLSADELAQVAYTAQRLEQAQETPDSSEALATLPVLTLADITEPAPEITPIVSKATPYTSISHRFETHGILYTYFYFDVRHLSYDELGLAGLLCNLLGKLDTELHTSSELDTLLEANLGSFSVYPAVYGRDDDLLFADPMCTVYASTLSPHIADLCSVVQEILSQTKFDDTEKIKTLITQQILGFEQALLNSGNTYALSRTASAFSAVSAISSQLSGLEHYFFLKDLMAHFDEKKACLGSELKDLCTHIFTADALTISVTGADDDQKRFWDYSKTFRLTHTNDARTDALIIPKLTCRREAFVIPSQVNFAACTHGPSLCNNASLGSWYVGTRILTYDYLWNEVRVKGGAYGVSFTHGPTRLPGFSTFRDPNIDASFSRFKEASGWLRSWKPSKSEFDGYVISTVASHDAPLRPRQLAHRQDQQILAGRDQSFRNRIREEELNCTPKDIYALSDVLADPTAPHALCVLGSRSAIEASCVPFDSITELMK